MLKTSCRGECCRAHPFAGVCAHRRRCAYHLARDYREAAAARRELEARRAEARVRLIAKRGPLT